MKRILHLAIHDTRLFLLAKENIFYMFIMPVMFMLFFSVVLRGGDPSSVSISLQVVNEDPGFLGELFVSSLEGEEFDVVTVAPAAADTTDYIRRLVIPADFTTSLMAERQVELGFTKQSSSNIEYDAAADVRLHQAQVAFLGSLVRFREAAGRPPAPKDRETMALLVAEPRRVNVRESFAGTGRPVPSGAGQSVPGMLAMFMVMIVLIGGSETLTREKLHGTLARLAATTFSSGEIIAGKLLHLVLVGVVQAAVLMSAGQAIGTFHVFGIDFSWGPNWWVLMVFIVPYAFAVAGITLFLGGVFRTTQQSESLGWLVGMVFAAMGGCWWPLEIMPQAAQIIALAFPTAWAMQALHGVVTFGRGLDVIVVPSLVVMGFGALFAWLGARTLRVKG